MIYIIEFDYTEFTINEVHNSIEDLIKNTIFSKSISSYAFKELKYNGYVYVYNNRVVIDFNHIESKTYMHYTKLIDAIRKYHIKNILL